MKKTLLATAIAGTMVVASGAQALEGKLSGQVNRAIISAHDFNDNYLQHVDNNVSGSRFRFTAKGDIGNGITAGVRFEEQIQKNKSSSVGGATKTNLAQANDQRYADISFSGSFGAVAMGQGDGAANGVTEDDMSGTDVIAYHSFDDLVGGYAITATENFGDIWKVGDGLSRNNRLRYDTPKFSGFSLAASTGQGESTELAVRYRGAIDDTKIMASLGQANSEDQTANDFQATGASLAVSFAGGFNALVGWSERTQDSGTGAEFESRYIKLGYKKGIHAFSIDFADGERDSNGTATANADSESIGVAWVATPAKGVELYAQIRTLEADIDGVSDEEDITTYAIGSRIKF
jgi:predicted porin